VLYIPHRIKRITASSTVAFAVSVSSWPRYGHLGFEVFSRVPRAPLEQFDHPALEIVLRIDRMYITRLSFLGGCT